MNPNQGWAGEEIAHDQGNCVFYGLRVVSGITSLKTEDSELAPARRELSRGYLANRRTHTDIISVLTCWPAQVRSCLLDMDVARSCMDHQQGSTAMNLAID